MQKPHEFPSIDKGHHDHREDIGADYLGPDILCECEGVVLHDDERSSFTDIKKKIVITIEKNASFGNRSYARMRHLASDAHLAFRIFGKACNHARDFQLFE